MILFNSLTGKKEQFVPSTERPTTLYVCGVTPYDTTHVGHARTYLLFDVLIRYLRSQGATIHYCQNVTDVDDPLFERAERDNIHWQDLAQREYQRFVTDCQDLRIIPPTFMPKASEEIAAMITIIEQLIAKGHAYVREGNVYFNIRSDPHFGSMARMGYDDMLATANQRGNNPQDRLKDDPLDFVLWQRGKPHDPAWESPWGLGRPGWHIECSAMASRYLGSQIDIHGGGNDLLFPHHSCEIAQMESATGKRPFSRFWMHVHMVYLDGKKMSKSLGNLVFVHKALQEHDANILRWYLLSVHYRQNFFYEPTDVGQFRSVLMQIQEGLTLKSGHRMGFDKTCAYDAFNAALADDLNTPEALNILTSISRDIHIAAEEGYDVHATQNILRSMAEVLGLKFI